jgi:multicomponent Na+:H+ antiporter subunit C
MSQWTLYALSGCALVVIALQGLFTTPHLVRRVIAANLVGAGVFLFLVALGRRVPDGPPDPVPHALVLTGIVVSVSATACALSMARRARSADDPAPPALDPRGAPDGP